MKKILLLLLVSILLFGSITQTYVQKVDSSGKSTFEEKRDMSIFLQLLPKDSLKKMTDACAVDPSLSCSVDGTVITTLLQVPADNVYYSFEREYGLLSTTTMTVYKFPNDLFDASINKVMEKAGLGGGTSRVAPINLNEKQENKAKSDALAQAGISLNYTIIMPGGKTQSFDMVAVLADSKPIVVQESELNYWLLVLIVGVVALIAFAYSFFRGNKGKAKKR